MFGVVATDVHNTQMDTYNIIISHYNFSDHKRITLLPTTTPKTCPVNTSMVTSTQLNISTSLGTSSFTSRQSQVINSTIRSIYFTTVLASTSSPDRQSSEQWIHAVYCVIIVIIILICVIIFLLFFIYQQRRKGHYSFQGKI